MVNLDLDVEDYLKSLNEWGYSENKECLIVGTTPPPIGGVSTHISRLLLILRKSNISYKVHDPSKKNRGYNFWGLFINILYNRYDQVHIHTPSLQILYAILVARFFFRFEIFLFAHNPIFYSDESKHFNKTLDKLLDRVSQINAVSIIAKEAIVKTRPHLEEKIFVKSSFLPPDITELTKIKQTYPDSLKIFLKEHSPIIILNAYRIHFKEGIDVYGLDLSIELLIRLSKKYPDIGMIFALGIRNSSSEYLESQVIKLEENNLSSHFYILDGFQELWALFSDCDLMIRPTLYDGYGISVSEAIMMGTKVVASDLTNRQKECIVFENRNIDSLEKVSHEVLSGLK